MSQYAPFSCTGRAETGVCPSMLRFLIAYKPPARYLPPVNCPSMLRFLVRHTPGNGVCPRMLRFLRHNRNFQNCKTLVISHAVLMQNVGMTPFFGYHTVPVCSGLSNIFKEFPCSRAIEAWSPVCLHGSSFDFIKWLVNPK